ncbi:hypothetical protein MSG28_011975 [Choristoneura fumiferana]|uniref:Uncharacterized protein n=1 Tax=Choristoneura fumiferana TaxID=7141 RepID=A0ACC0KMF9_CHOFU|nr:hypothetical protein MSG28_011975 [Choristoneura fumiferana]
MESDLEDELSVGVAEYLKEWGLSQFTITNFEENQISFKLLDCIQATELKELIPNFKERILLNQLQNIIHTTESDKTLSVDSDFSAPSTTASTSSNEVADHEREISSSYHEISRWIGGVGQRREIQFAAGASERVDSHGCDSDDWCTCGVDRLET